MGRVLGKGLPPGAIDRIQIDLDPHPAKKILGKAEEAHVDLILTYNPQRKSFDQMLKNNTVEHVAGNSTRPVGVIPCIDTDARTRPVEKAA